jgi:hypothetical protein
MAEWSQKLSAPKGHGRMVSNFLHHRIHGRNESQAFCRVGFMVDRLSFIEFTMAEWVPGLSAPKSSWQNGLKTFGTRVLAEWDAGFPFKQNGHRSCTIGSWQNGSQGFLHQRVHGRMVSELGSGSSWQNGLRNFLP